MPTNYRACTRVSRATQHTLAHGLARARTRECVNCESAFIVPSTSWHSPSGRRCDKGQISERTLASLDLKHSRIISHHRSRKIRSSPRKRLTPNRSVEHGHRSASTAVYFMANDIDYCKPNLFVRSILFFFFFFAVLHYRCLGGCVKRRFL